MPGFFIRARKNLLLLSKRDHAAFAYCCFVLLRDMGNDGDSIFSICLHEMSCLNTLSANTGEVCQTLVTKFISLHFSSRRFIQVLSVGQRHRDEM